MGYILSISGGVNAILFNSIRMAVLGAILRIFFEYFKNNYKINQT
jgi:hypothetical protein